MKPFFSRFDELKRRVRKERSKLETVSAIQSAK